MCTWKGMQQGMQQISCYTAHCVYGKRSGSKIESTKRTVIIPKNLRVLAKNVRVFYKRICFIILLHLPVT